MVWSAHSAAALSVLASATKDTTASLYLCAVCLSVCLLHIECSMQCDRRRESSSFL